MEAGVSRVVIAMTDPNPKVAGKGIQILREAGVEVVTGVLKKEAYELNEVFLKWITTGKPFVVSGWKECYCWGRISVDNQ